MDFSQLLTYLSIVLDGFSVLILIIGVIFALVDFIKLFIHKYTRQEHAEANNLIKNALGSYILLSLEVLIAADIIDSIVHPTLEDILKLGLVVIIRTIISYFLNKEIESTERAIIQKTKLEEQNHDI